MNTQIREYKNEDKESCMSAFKSCVPKFFTEEEVNLFDTFFDDIASGIIDEKYNEKTFYYVITFFDENFEKNFEKNISQKNAEKIIGCGGFAYSEVKNEVKFVWGLLHFDFHKKGFGEKLLQFRLEEIKKIYPKATILLDTTQHSFSFFEKYGFVTTKITNDSYAVGMHRYDMILQPEKNL